MRRSSFIAVSGLVLGLLAAAWAQPPEQKEAELTALANHGKNELSSRSFDSALEVFARGRELSVGLPDWEARFEFYLGLARQKKGESETGEERTSNLRLAVRRYRRVLRMRPDSASTLNNLAQCYEGLGQNKEAAGYYRRAIAADTGGKSVYQLNYADFLSSTGKWKDAAPIYQEIAREAPQSDGPHRKLVDVYIGNADDQLMPYLWKILGDGQAAKAESAALEALKAQRWPSQAVDELFAIVAVSLSKQLYRPEAFADSPGGQALKDLSESADSSISACADELMKAHSPDDLWSNSFSWWSRRGSPRREPPRGVWPRDGFRRLLRSLGTRYQQYGEDEKAESYFRRAATLAEEDLDPAAFRKLVDLYVDQNRGEELEALARDYERQLFKEKNAVYRDVSDLARARKSQLEKLFEYHQTLGELYSYLGKDESRRSTAASAIFQLQRAMSVDEILSEKDPTDKKEVRFQPHLAELLAKAYEEDGQTRKSREVRVKAAQRYAAAEDHRAVYQVLRPIEPNLSGSDKQLYERSLQKVPEESLKRETLKPTRPPL